MIRPRLSISIPTYNRGAMLLPLLMRLRAEIDRLPDAGQDLVEVIVCDNASTDDTEAEVSALGAGWARLTYARAGVNGGMDANFRRCWDLANGEFLWVIGDDDLPVAGTLGPLLRMLDEHVPDCVYLNNRWMKDVGAFTGSNEGRALAYRCLPALEFARETFVWLTFLSAVIVNRAMVAAEGSAASWLDRLNGSHLTQLAWVLTAVRQGQTFILVDTACVLATSGNTGGYAVMNTFAVKFVDIVNAMLGARAPMATVITQRSKTLYLPDLVWSGRLGSLGSFAPGEGWADIDRKYAGDAFFRWVLRPLARCPRPLAWAVWMAWRVYSRSIRSADARRRLRAETVR